MTKWVLITTVSLAWQLVFSGINVSNVQTKDITLRFGNTLEEIFKQWKLKTLVGKDEYEVIKKENGNVLHVLSNQSSSILYKSIEFDVNEYPTVRWHWMVNKFPEYKEKEDHYNIDDYAARLCVVFPSWSLWTTKFIVYVWDDRASDIGEIKPSAFSKNCKIIVVEKGKQNSGKWVTEERNVLEDYKTLFGKYPRKNSGGIAIMSDSDDTKTSTDACYYNIYLRGES